MPLSNMSNKDSTVLPLTQDITDDSTDEIHLSLTDDYSNILDECYYHYLHNPLYLFGQPSTQLKWVVTRTLFTNVGSPCHWFPLMNQCWIPWPPWASGRLVAKLNRRNVRFGLRDSALVLAWDIYNNCNI